MPEIATVRTKTEWLEQAVDEAGTLSAFAEEIGVETSTVSRQLSGKTEASPRFIGAVLVRFPIDFSDAFEVTVEEVKARRARIVKRPTGVRVQKVPA